MIISLRHWVTFFAAAAALLSTSACGKAEPRNVAPPGKNLGVNVSTLNYWDGSRPFANLIYGSAWQMQDPNGRGSDVPAAALDAAGWIKALPPGHQAIRILSMPAATAKILCRWQGNDHGSMSVASSRGPLSSSRPRGQNELSFRYVSTYPGQLDPAYLKFRVDASDPVRNIDCREPGLAASARFDPTFVETARGFSVIRFMKWQTAVEANTPVRWSTRNKPGDADYLGSDGVPVEEMLALAKEIGADPWFTMPWNADDDYIIRFATAVRDGLLYGRRAYVELSNEVWNGGYPVMHQAEREGAAEQLDSRNGSYGQAMYRYAERTQQVMQLWSKVFAGQEQRIVRVASAQHVSPFWSAQILGYGDTAKHVDALATAPYWALSDEDDRGQSLDHYMDKLLPTRLGEALDYASQQRAVAHKFGKRYIAYEGGQHVWLNKNEPLVAKIERDPRMTGLYTSYIDGWNRRIGDTLTLFALTGPIGYAGFGLVEYPGQPIEQAPKMRAVRVLTIGPAQRSLINGRSQNKTPKRSKVATGPNRP